MEILNKVQKIFAAHPFAPIFCGEHKNVYRLIEASPDLYVHFKHPVLSDGVFLKKYREHIPRGWYGFSIGVPIIPIWMEIIDEILEVCKEADPNFEIHQVKMKFGGIDFHVESEVITDMWEVFKLVSSTLHDKALIY